MKITLQKISLSLLLLFPLLLAASDGNCYGKYSKEKTIKKEFSVDADAVLKVDNSYGNLNITSWNENRVVIEVHIKTAGNNEEKVLKKLNQISVDFEATNQLVSARTVFEKSRSNWGWNWGSNNDVHMQINYTIKVPIKNNVRLNNDYGSIILDRIDGHAKISCDYGRLEIGELRGRNNELNFDYTSKSTIEFMNSGTIKADYSDFTIEKAGDLIIKADYTNSTIRSMKNLDYSSDYGNITVESAENIQGNGSYITIKLGTVHGNVAINTDYGSVKIAKMAADAGNVKIHSDYTGIKIGYDPNYHFNFEINTSYAGVRGIDDFELNISQVKNTSKYYKGYYGNETSPNFIDLSSDYGGITLYQN